MAQQVVIIHPNVPTQILFDFVANNIQPLAANIPQPRTFQDVDVEIQVIRDSQQPLQQKLANVKEQTTNSANTVKQLQAQLLALKLQVEQAELDFSFQIESDKKIKDELSTLKQREEILLKEKIKLREEALSKARNTIVEWTNINEKLPALV